jgi:hypothetical protein
MVSAARATLPRGGKGIVERIVAAMPVHMKTVTKGPDAAVVRIPPG